MKTKTYFVIFSNASSILELMLCNGILTKVVYQNSLNSDSKARALKLSECFKNYKIFHKNRAKKDIKLKVTMGGPDGPTFKFG